MKLKKRFAVLLSVMMLFPSIHASALAESARATALICVETGEVIFGTHTEERLPMASTTKIMTALLLCEAGEPERTLTVTEEMVRVEGSSMGLLPGDTVSRHDLLYGMLLASGNDAANVTAYHLGGSVKDFLKLMNRRAAELGLEHTHFSTPSGLDAEDHYTTALDLARLAAYALGNPDFSAACASQSAVLNYGNPPYRRTLTNHNRLLKSYDGAVGVKTGFTKKAGRCLVSAAKRGGVTLVAVTLHDPNDWDDHRALLDYGFSKIKMISCVPPVERVEIPVSGGLCETVGAVLPQTSIPATTDSKVDCDYSLPRLVFAPVTAGEQLGKLRYMMNGKTVAELSLCAENDVPAVKSKKLTLYFQLVKLILCKI